MHTFIAFFPVSPQLELTIKIVGFVGSLVGIWSAYITLKSLHQSKELVASLSTKFEREFPHYLPTVLDIIKRSKRRLLILGNIPTHGAYTKRDIWLEINLAVNAKIIEQQNKRRIGAKGGFEAIIGYGDAQRREDNYKLRYGRFINDPLRWEQWKKKNENKQQIKDFLELVPEDKSDPLPDYDGLSVERLIKARNAYDEHIVQTTFRLFDQFPADEQLPVFIWIADDEAVFTFKTEDLEGQYNGHGIYTRDGKLIETLEQTVASYMKKHESKKISRPGSD